MDLLKAKLLEYGFSVVVAPLAMLFIQLLKGWSFTVDKMKPWPKRILVAVTVAVFLAAGAAFGIDFGITPDTDNLDFISKIEVGSLKTVLGALFAHILWMAKKGIFRNS